MIALVPAHARFYLLFTDQPTGGFDLMAQCALCGALAEQSLAHQGRPPGSAGEAVKV